MVVATEALERQLRAIRALRFLDWAALNSKSATGTGATVPPLQVNEIKK